MGQINTTLMGLIAPLAGAVTAGLNAISRAFAYFMLNPVYAIIGFYVFMVALKGGSFKLGSKASTNVKG